LRLPSAGEPPLLARNIFPRDRDQALALARISMTSGFKSPHDGTQIGRIKFRCMSRACRVEPPSLVGKR